MLGIFLVKQVKGASGRNNVIWVVWWNNKLYWRLSWCDLHWKIYSEDRNYKDTYEYLYKTTPKVGAIVDTREGKGTVVETNILAGTVKVQLERRPEAAPSVYSKKDVKIIKDGKIHVDKSELDALKGIE